MSFKRTRTNQRDSEFIGMKENLKVEEELIWWSCFRTDIVKRNYNPVGEVERTRMKELEDLSSLKKRVRLTPPLEKIGVKVSSSRKRNTILFHFHCFLSFPLLVQILFLDVWNSGVVSASSTSSHLTWNNDTSYPLSIWDAIAFVGQDHCIYVFGGDNSSNIQITSSYKFNTTPGTPREWTKVASMPTDVYGAAGCINNDGRFFVFGGFEASGESPNYIQIYNAMDDSWNTMMPNMSDGISIDDHYMSCAIDDRRGLMYITGGKYDGKRFYSYNVSSNTMTDLATSSSSPLNTHGQGSFVVNNSKLYVFGGYEGSASTYIYDIGSNNWTSGSNMKQGAWFFGYVTDGSRFYAIGGYDLNAVYLNYTQVYTISSEVWSIDEGIVYPRGIDGGAAVLLDGSLHSIGGYDYNGDYVSVHRIATLCGVYVFSGPCDNIEQCTINGTCQSNGECIGSSNVSCPTPSNPCQSNVCDSVWGCYIPTGTSCTLSDKCFLETTCNSGECIGQSMNCSCDPSTGECVSFSLSTGAILGIVIGILVFLVIVTVASVLLLKYQRKRLNEKIYSSSIDISIRSGATDVTTSYTGIEPSGFASDNDGYTIKIAKLEIKRKIGEGAFGCVYLGIFNRIEVAIKQLSKANVTAQDIKEFMAEADLMRNLPPHPNVVLFRGVTVPPDPLSIVTDYCNGGSLNEFLRRNPKVPISKKIQFIKDIAKGMVHLHCAIPGREVIHRDLAARNILLRNGVALITDFGLSRVKVSVDDYQKTRQNVGPVKWMSPESLFENKYSTKSDVFSFAVVIYEIIAQEPPWKDLNAVQVVGKVSKGHRMVLPESCECPPVLKDLMGKCWAQLPADRPDFKKICSSLEGLS